MVSRGSFYGLGAAGYGRGGGTAAGHGQGAGMGMGYSNNNANANGFQLSGYGGGGGQVNGAGGGDFGGFGGVKQAETQPVYNFNGNRGRGGPMRSSGVHTPAMTVSTGLPPNYAANVVNNNNGTPARQQQQYEGVQNQLRPEVVTHSTPAPANLTNYPMRKQNSYGMSGGYGYGTGACTFNVNGEAQVDHTAPASMAVGSISTRANANAGEDVAMVKELFEEIGHICANMANVYGKLAQVFGDRIVENEGH